MTIERTQHAVLETILRPGQVVAGKYRVDSLIGKGGMAAVWAGTNQRTGKRVALKVILRSFASSPEAEEMFRREALAASRVNHPNVVNVFDVVEHEGMTCIVMELLDGESLGAYLLRKQGRHVEIEEAVALLLPAMRGVAAANALGIIHRDLKPQNLFVCMGPDGQPLTTKVVDFGISVMVERAMDASSETVVTMHGTPAYMSPEHIMNAPDIDQRSDVYGFGILLFEVLTGHLPFSGEPGPALLMRVLNEPAPKASIFRPDLRPEMVATIERALAKSPQDRFSTVNDFIAALEEHFLRRSRLPRSLTPMVGVPLLGPDAGGSVVQVARRAEGSQANDTKELFVLPPESPPEGDPGRRIISIGVPPEGREPARGRALRTVASAGAFLGALLVVGWFALPRANGPGTRPSAAESPRPALPAVPPPAAAMAAPSPERASPPGLSPTPSMPKAATDPAVVVPKVAASVPAVEVPKAGRTARSTTRPSSGKANSRTGGAAGNEPVVPSPLVPPPAPAPPASPPPKTGPRAGNLSADDF
jgi:serine/threonine protein kinase